MPLPYQGNPGVFNYNGNPTLVPNFYQPSMSLGGTLDAVSPAAFDKANPRVAATALVTIGGSVAAGNTVTMTLTQVQLPSGAISVTYTCVTSDTVQTVAAQLASALNAAIAAELGNFLGFNIFFTVGTALFATEAELIANWLGPLGNSAVLSGSHTGSISLTFTPSGGALSGGSGPVYAANNFTFSYNNCTLNFTYGQQRLVDTALAAALVSQDMPVV